MAFTTSGQETEWAYSYSPGAHTRQVGTHVNEIRRLSSIAICRNYIDRFSGDFNTQLNN